MQRVSSARRRLSDDRRDLDDGLSRCLFRLFRAFVALALDSGECSLQVRVEARGISERGVENRFHEASQSGGAI